jgi:hypothetical protein
MLKNKTRRHVESRRRREDVKTARIAGFASLTLTMLIEQCSSANL